MKNKKIWFLLAIIFVLSILVYMYKKPVIMFLGREYKMYFVHTTKLDLKSSPLREGEEEKLRYFKNLKSLNFRTSTVNNLNFLNEMNYLENLHIGGVFNDDFTPLSNQKGLKKLSIRSNINDLSFLNNMKDLEQFILSSGGYLDKIQIERITNLKKLKGLELRYCKLETFSPVNNCEELEHLGFWKVKVNGTVDFSKLTDVKILNIVETDIDVEQILLMGNLEKVFIAEDQFSETDIKKLENKGIEVKVHWLFRKGF